MIRILTGDCREQLRTLPDASIDACVTDPPYELGFMGKAWDRSGIANDPAAWAEVLRVLKPGAHLLAFGGTRTYHRMVCAIEDAGFEIRDQIMWIYGSGFPKSLDVSKAIDKAAGAVREVTQAGSRKLPEDAGKFTTLTSSLRERRDMPASEAARQWEGWGTALKPAHEPIVVARKPLQGTVAANVVAHGTGALNIDACRVPGDKPDTTRGAGGKNGRYGALGAQGRIVDDGLGRWPANLIHDGSDEVLAAFPDAPRAARFFYSAKATAKDRNIGGVRNVHPTVKPTALMQYLVRLVTPPGGTVLDPFAGSGSTGVAADREGFDAVLMEREPDYAEIARMRIVGDSPLCADVQTPEAAA